MNLIAKAVLQAQLPAMYIATLEGISCHEQEAVNFAVCVVSSKPRSLASANTQVNVKLQGVYTIVRKM